MSGPFKKSSQLTFEDLFSATSSPESADGTKPCGSPVGQLTDPCGPEVVRASHSRRPAKGKPKPTTATSGRTSSASSASAALSASLANRLKARLATVGSVVYKQTWKEKVTPSGIVYWAHTASVPTTSGSGCTGWPTPDVPCGGQGLPTELEFKGGTAYTKGRKVQIKLQHAAQLAPWPTPMAGEAIHNYTDHHDKNPTLTGLAKGFRVMSPWATPTKADGQKVTPFHDAPQPALAYQCHLASWATPTTRDHKDGACQDANVPVNCLLGRQAVLVSGTPATLSSAGTGKSDASRKAVLNPGFSLWLMGFPAEWLWHAPESKPSPRATKKKTKKSAG